MTTTAIETRRGFHSALLAAALAASCASDHDPNRAAARPPPAASPSPSPSGPGVPAVPGETTLAGTGAPQAADAGTGTGPDAAADPSAAGAADRAYNVEVLTTIAEPVLDALSRGVFIQTFPVHEWEQERAAFTHYEAFARTLAGIAPWLELGPDATPEGEERARFIGLAQAALINATDPQSPDYLNFDGEQGDQPLVEHAYFASALMLAPTQLWEPLTAAQRENVLDALRMARAIENTHNNNWILFPAMVEAALWQFTGEFEREVIEDAIETFEDEWYLGDGVYADGRHFSWDYYNSYVIHPFMLQILRVAEAQDDELADSLRPAMQRALRYAEVLERMISPEGTFPVIGRSSAYRFAAFITWRTWRCGVTCRARCPRRGRARA